MDFYTLTRGFVREHLLENIVSSIWTERYTEAGEAVISVPATQANAQLLKPGTFLACSDSREVALLDTMQIKDNVLSVSGKFITAFLNNRVVRGSAYWNATSIEFPAAVPGYLMANLVQWMCIEGPFVESPFPWFGVDGVRQKIANLTLGDLYTGGSPTIIAVTYGPLYDAVKNLAETYQIGFSMYLHSASSSGYSLKFTTYKGRDLTSWATPTPVVFSPFTDSLANVEEFLSFSDYKNVAYAYATNFVLPTYAVGMGIAEVDGGLLKDDFERRTMMVFCDDIQVPEGTEPHEMPPNLIEILNARARDALANNNYTKVVDGEVVPQSKYKYGVDYKLGDLSLIHI